ncbi:45404_t:CDS:2, partial [Gigaspora margarita]
ENINEFSKKVIGILKANNFNMIVKETNDNYTVVQDFNELYDTTYNYKPPTNPHHNHEIKKFHDHDHIIVHKESLDKDGCSKIEGYTEGITEKGFYAEKTTCKKPLRYSYSNEKWMIFHIVNYFSYQYAISISKQKDINKMDSFAKYMSDRVKKEKFSNFDKFCEDYELLKKTKNA